MTADATNRALPGGQSGQSFVELALITPVLILILLIVIDLGTLFFAHETVAGAAHVGAMWGSSSASAAANSTGIASAARAGTTNLLGYSSSNPSVASGVTTEGSYQAVTVTVTYTVSPIFPYPFVPSSYTVTRSAKMRVKP